ncbi:MAG: 4-hydroxy-tetrahydrodipicolinate synthase [Acidimicrobiia bacterium]
MEHRPDAPFGRVLTAIITPFSSDGSIDYATFWRLIRHLGNNGSDGVVVAGTTGEAPTLSKPEKMALFRAAVDAAKGSMQVVAGAGTYDTRESVALAEVAAAAGANGVMAVTPYYSRPPQRGIAAHMRAVADATDLPMMMYNIPIRTATRIEIETLVELSHHPRIVAIKDAVGDLDWSREALRELPEGMAVYSGNDTDTRELVAANAVGVVSVTSHLAGREIAEMVDAVVAGDHDRADRLHDLVMPLNNALFAEPSPMPLKSALNAYWDGVGDPRLPLMPAEPSTVEAIGRELEAINEYRSPSVVAAQADL